MMSDSHSAMAATQNEFREYQDGSRLVTLTSGARNESVAPALCVGDDAVVAARIGTENAQQYVKSNAPCIDSLSSDDDQDGSADARRTGSPDVHGVDVATSPASLAIPGPFGAAAPSGPIVAVSQPDDPNSDNSDGATVDDEAAMPPVSCGILLLINEDVAPWRKTVFSWIFKTLSVLLVLLALVVIVMACVAVTSSLQGGGRASFSWQTQAPLPFIIVSQLCPLAPAGCHALIEPSLRGGRVVAAGGMQYTGRGGLPPVRKRDMPSVAVGLPHHWRPGNGGGGGMQPALPDTSEASPGVNLVSGSTFANWTSTCKAMWAYAASLPIQQLPLTQALLPSSQLSYMWRPTALSSAQRPPAPSRPPSLGQQLPSLRPPPPRYLPRPPPTPPLLPPPRSHSHTPRSLQSSQQQLRPLPAPPPPAPLIHLSTLIVVLHVLRRLGRLLASVLRKLRRSAVNLIGKIRVLLYPAQPRPHNARTPPPSSQEQPSPKLSPPPSQLQPPNHHHYRNHNGCPEHNGYAETLLPALGVQRPSHSGRTPEH